MDDLVTRFAATLDPGDSQTLADVREYTEWQAVRRATFTPSASDDVDLRTYLLRLRMAGVAADTLTLTRKTASLKRFYEWAVAEALIDSNPFARLDIDRAILSHGKTQGRDKAAASYPQEHESVRLRALNRLAEELNRSVDVQTALDAALETVVKVMGLRTGWVSLLSDGSFITHARTPSPPHGFVLGAAYGLPPALEQNDRYYLRRPPACHCQMLLRAGLLTHAINIVKCTRLRDAANAAGDTRGLTYHATVPIISQGRSLGTINVATDEWQLLAEPDLELLSDFGGQVAIALDRARLYDLAQAQRARLEHELEMARAVQASLLPGQLPSIPGFGLAASWSPAREVAGDFYNVFPLDGGRLGIVVADVSDKGAAAALYMVIAHSLIRTKAGLTSSPAEALMLVNRDLIAQSSAEMFVTVFYGILDPATHTLTYTNAGHNPPIVRRASASNRTEVLPLGGLILGILEKVSLADATISLAPGDALVLYTDGLTEAENPQGEGFGLTRLAAAIAAAPSEASGLHAHVLAELAAFTASASQMDDITLLVVTSES